MIRHAIEQGWWHRQQESPHKQDGQWLCGSGPGQPHTGPVPVIGIDEDDATTLKAAWRVIAV